MLYTAFVKKGKPRVMHRPPSLLATDFSAITATGLAKLYGMRKYYETCETEY